jgi:hypothetical protein
LGEFKVIPGPRVIRGFVQCIGRETLDAAGLLAFYSQLIAGHARGDLLNVSGRDDNAAELLAITAQLIAGLACH